MVNILQRPLYTELFENNPMAFTSSQLLSPPQSMHSSGAEDASAGAHDGVQLPHREAPHRRLSSSSNRSTYSNSQAFPISNGVRADVQNQSHHQDQRAQCQSQSIPGQAQSQRLQQPDLRWRHDSFQSRAGRELGTSSAEKAPHLRVAPQSRPPVGQTPSNQPVSTQSPALSNQSHHHRPLASQPMTSSEEDPHQRPNAVGRKLYDPRTNQMRPSQKPRIQYPTAVFTGPSHAQVSFLEQLALSEISKAEMSREELDEKETFRLTLQNICRDTVTQHELGRNKYFNAASVSLKCFGSLSTGFATHSSDMDLALVSPNSEPDMSSAESQVPRLLEKAFLEAGYGARLLTKTRVPIIKLCQKPTSTLRAALLDERSKWEKERDNPPEASSKALTEKTPRNSLASSSLPSGNAPDKSVPDSGPVVRSDEELVYLFKLAMGEGWYEPSERQVLKNFIQAVEKPNSVGQEAALVDARDAIQPFTEVLKRYRPPQETHLDFPKNGIGIQCDINFSNTLALHNTRLLRCYSLCDPRVRLIIIFIKAWASKRQINSPYHGTLSSYGYVLMVLHYLANIVEPAIIPNLQQCGKALRDNSPENSIPIDGYNVRFWRSETEIRDRVRRKLMTKNHEDSIGIIICGFFHYFAHQNMYTPHGGFQWTNEVLSLRTKGGILLKKNKGWTGAISVVTEPTAPGEEPREVRHRYLLAIEDPFETDHNIARTVVHYGIVSIRNEFRRAVSIIQSVGLGIEGVEELFAEARERPSMPRKAFGPLLRKHGPATKDSSPQGTQGGGVPQPQGQLTSPTDQGHSRLTLGLNQLNINSGGVGDKRRKFSKAKRGNEPLQDGITSDPSRQPTSMLASEISSSNSNGPPSAPHAEQPRAQHHEQTMHP